MLGSLFGALALSSVGVSFGGVEGTPMARTTGRCARKKKPGAPAPLHTLQGLRALARIESPGGPQIFFFFWDQKEKKNPKPSLPLFSKKSVQSVQALQYPVYHPLSSASYIRHPPLYQPL